MSVMTSLPQQVVSMGTIMPSAGMTCSQLPAVQTVILVPTTMVPENTALTLPAGAQLQTTTLATTATAATTSVMNLKPLSLQVTTGMVSTPTRTPPLKPPKKFRSEQEEQTRCKRRLDFASLGLHSLQRPTGSGGNRRNERERNRVKLINNTFVRLQEHLPQVANTTSKRRKRKLSKVDTLRGAIEYIYALQNLLDDHDAVSAAFSSGHLGSESMSQDSQFTPAMPSPSSLSSGLASPGSSSLCSGTSGSLVEDTECPLSPDEQDLIDFASWFE